MSKNVPFAAVELWPVEHASHARDLGSNPV